MTLVRQKLEATKRSYAVALSRLEDAKQRSLKAAHVAKLSRQEARLASQVHTLLIGLADKAKDTIRTRVEDAIQYALASVFGDGVAFRFAVEVKRGVVCMTPLVGYKDESGNVEWMGLGDVGGGVLDIVSFAARVTLLRWHRPQLRQVLIADEPFKHVSNEYLPRVAKLVRHLADASGLQLILVSHEKDLAAAAHNLVFVSRSQRFGSSALAKAYG